MWHMETRRLERNDSPIDINAIFHKVMFILPCLQLLGVAPLWIIKELATNCRKNVPLPRELPGNVSTTNR